MVQENQTPPTTNSFTILELYRDEQKVENLLLVFYCCENLFSIFPLRVLV